MSEKKEKDLKKVKELIDLMITHDLIELEIADGDSKIVLKRPQPVYNAVSTPITASLPFSGAPQSAAADQQVIRSPIVGTFYAAASPDSKPYATVGSKVNPDTVVCIIEAMKVMNEIKAQTSGTITAVLCQAGQAVEYDEPLFKIRPD